MTRPIVYAIRNAYEKARIRNWDRIYWAVDLHDTCLKANYETGGYEFINEEAKKALQMISSRRESKIILWSSVHKEEQRQIVDFLDENVIFVSDFNHNFYEQSNKLSCFEEKFYFSVLLDDKAGFDPREDWSAIINFFLEKDIINDAVKKGRSLQW